MKSRIILILAIFTFSLTACEFFFDCIDGNGNVQTEERAATSFNSIANETSFYVEYIESDVVSVTVEAESNIIPHIKTDIRNGCLEVSTTRGTGCVNYTVQPRVTITGPSVSELINSGSGDIVAGALTGEEVNIMSSGSGDITTGTVSCTSADLHLSGSGKIHTDAIEANDVRAYVSGSGDIETSGVSGTAKYYLSGSGKIDAEDLEVDDADITISGSGSVYTTVLKYLEASISGSGNVYLTGEPSVTLHRSGSGKIIYR